MARMLVVCAALAALPPFTRSEEAPKRTVIALRVQAMPAPKPALRYPLLPEMAEMNPGNPIQGYMKCFMEQENFFYSKPSWQNREKWLTMPLKDLPLEELRDYGGAALRYADYAARLDNPDWQTLLKLKSDGAYLTMPEIQGMRTLASALKVRWRAEVAERRFEDALRTARTMFALARHLGEHPTAIGHLVGYAVSFLAIGVVEEMVQQPGCPNLYWSLTDLPSPFLDLRKAMQGERAIMVAEFALFDTTEPMTEAQLERAVQRLERLFKGIKLLEGLSMIYSLWPSAGPESKAAPWEKPREWLEGRARDKTFVAAARKRLVEFGLSAEAVGKLPALQVVLLDEKREFSVQQDELMKWRGVPPWQMEAYRKETPKKDRDGWLFSELLPSLSKVTQAQVRLEQRIALLRHVEAIRLYAAEQGGKLPASLADVPVPLPADPFTGKPFIYRVEGGKAILRGSPPRGQETNRNMNQQYEVTLRP